MKAKKKTVYVCALTEQEQELLAGVLTVQNMGNTLKVVTPMPTSENPMPKPRLSNPMAGVNANLKGLTGRGVLNQYYQHVGADLEACGGSWGGLLEEMAGFAKDLKRGLPDYWKDVAVILEAWRGEQCR